MVDGATGLLVMHQLVVLVHRHVNASALLRLMEEQIVRVRHRELAMALVPQREHGVLGLTVLYYVVVVLKIEPVYQDLNVNLVRLGQHNSHAIRNLALCLVHGVIGLTVRSRVVVVIKHVFVCQVQMVNLVLLALVFNFAIRSLVLLMEIILIGFQLLVAHVPQIKHAPVQTHHHNLVVQIAQVPIHDHVIALVTL